MPSLRTPAALFTLALAAAPLQACNGCFNKKDKASAKRKGPYKSEDPFGDARPVKRDRKAEQEQRKQENEELHAAGKTRRVALSAGDLADDAREVAPEVAAARDLIKGDDEAKRTEGIAALDTWIAAHPDDADALHWRGRGYAAAKDHAKAAPDFGLSVEKDATWVNGFRWAAFNQFQIDGCTNAISYLEKAVELAPEDPISHFDRAQCRAELRALQGAAEDAKRACDLGLEAACEKAKRYNRRAERIKAKRGR